MRLLKVSAKTGEGMDDCLLLVAKMLAERLEETPI
jgi:translation initiation factor IF-2